MGVEEGYARRVQEMGQAELLALWGRVRRRERIEGGAPGRAFEFLLLRAFQLEGAKVVWPYASVIEQIDGGVYVDGLSCLVEAKDHAEPIGFEAIARLSVRMQRRPSPALGLLFSTSGFTWPALKAVAAHPLRNVLLWRDTDIAMALEHGMRASLRRKWRVAVEVGTLDHPLAKEDFR
ncbi:restriction endonuclease [Pyxidicoccus xibeiensis]|uniref:restriction endonuclease n=1 Tax=Pyxidicoccus xibeiensis TaxID=2906759 RepID=UPI0020A6E001|nr:restriction endonuclease [Pyxidicoccus xibeiensis]MCP3145111.1 restriction endonuclease [Pyxidicoccus xibeiensis]